MAREGLLDRPRVRIVQLPSLHGWLRLRQGMSRHDSGIVARGRGRLVGGAQASGTGRGGPGPPRPRASGHRERAP